MATTEGVLTGSPWTELDLEPEPPTKTEKVCPSCNLVSNRTLIAKGDCPNCWENL